MSADDDVERVAQAIGNELIDGRWIKAEYDARHEDAYAFLKDAARAALSAMPPRVSPYLIAQLNKLATYLTAQGEYEACDLIDTVVARVTAMPQRELLAEALEALSEAAAIFDAIKRHGGTISQQVHTFASGPRTEAKEAWAFPKWMFDELDSAENDARAAADKIRAALTQEPQT